MLAPKRSCHPQGHEAVVEFTALIGEAWRLRSKATSTRHRAGGAAFHKGGREGATPSAGISGS